ncbi:MAG TPA: VOC family protein [Pseudonocardiaceae bacterium]|jgi:catechol 2,3-dioxygenase-like lactoylglutathione lyase family enzyme|nr:VOC family protein [Pseudonocardiaceae bacterium]
MTPLALWLPYQVKDLAAVRGFYRDRIGLSEIDSWDRDAEHGVVLAAASGARLEFVAPGWSGPAPLAFELATRAAVDDAFAGWRPAEVLAPPHRFPRGHYGFEVRDPLGTRVLVWSEKR